LLRLIILITFLESFVTAMVERGVAFYAEDQLHFSQSENLWLALLFGGAYVAGAMGSHRCAHALGERCWLVIMIVGHVLMHLGLALEPGWEMVFVFNTVLGALSGSKWPIIESYVSAGLTPKQSATAVGHFNLAWSLSVVPAVALGGLLIETWAPSLFLLPAIINAGVLFLIFRLPKCPTHLDDDHPERPTETQGIRLRSLLYSSRWSMFGSYTLMFLLAPLLPYIFKERLDMTPGPAMALISLIDLARLLTFAAMQRYTGWHGRRSLLIWTAVLMPTGFLMILAGADLYTILIGELLFGLAAGLTYYAALYYAMVMKNAAVEAAGAHEGIIGLGFVIGPALGIGGVALTGVVGTATGAMLVASGPFLAVCGAGALWSLRSAADGDRMQFPD